MPGAGKSTLLKYQSLQYLKALKDITNVEHEKTFIPLFIQLREFTKYEGYMSKRICNYIYDQFGEEFISVRDIVEVYFDCGLFAVFFDGLDEIADTGQRNKMASDISIFSEDFPHSLIVITCRIAAYSEITANMSRFEKLTIDDMKEKQRYEFIHRWYKAREEQYNSNDIEKLAGNLISKIERTCSIRRLAVNPLMLTIMAIIYSDHRDLPETRLELYEECVNVLIHRRDKARGLMEIQRFESIVPKIEFILGELAYALHTESEARGGDMIEPLREEINNRITDIIIRRRKVEDICKHESIEHQEVPSLCKFIEERTCILADRGMGRYGFAHLTFQEYFAAYYLNTIKNIDDLWKEIANKLIKPFWREVFLLLSEMLARGQDVLDIIFEKYCMENENSKSAAQLLLFCDLIIQGTPVTDLFKFSVIRELYQEIHLTNYASKYLHKLQELRDHGLGYEIYKFVENELLSKDENIRLRAIQFMINNIELFQFYKEFIKEALSIYKEKEYKSELIIPLMFKLDVIVPDIFCKTDYIWLTSPYDYPSFFRYYFPILKNYESSIINGSVLKKLSAASFIYSSKLFHAILTISRGRGSDSALKEIFRRVAYLSLYSNSLDWIDLHYVRSKANEVAKRIGISRSKATIYRKQYEVFTERNLRIDLGSNYKQEQMISFIENFIQEPLFQAAMIHLSAIFELAINKNKKMPDQLKLATNSTKNCDDPFVRTAFIIYNLVQKKISVEQKDEFSQYANHFDKNVVELFKLAYLEYNFN